MMFGGSIGSDKTVFSVASGGGTDFSDFGWLFWPGTPEKSKRLEKFWVENSVGKSGSVENGFMGVLVPIWVGLSGAGRLSCVRGV